MKTVILTLAALFLVTALTAQPSKINSTDFGHYYLYNNKLFDSRLNKPIFPNLTLPGELSFSAPEKRLYHAHSQVQKYDESGKLTATLESSYATFSMDFKTAVYTKDGDIWSAKVDPTTGKLQAGSKVTQLGIFNDYAPVVNWYENNLVVLAPDNSVYSLNLADGQIKQLPIDLRMLDLERQNVYPNAYRAWWSPTKRYIILMGNSNRDGRDKDFVLDMKTMRLKPFEQQLTPPEPGWDNQPIQYWLADSIALVYAGNNVSNQGGKFYWLNLNTMATRSAFHPTADFNKTWGAVLAAKRLQGVSKSFSTGFSYLLLPMNQQSGTNNLAFLVFNLQYGAYSKLDVPLSDYYLFGTPDYYEWISDSSFVFRMKGDISTQGTWLYNVKKKERKKLTSYLLDKAIALPKSGKILFIANEQLYSANVDGSDVKQILPEKSPQFLLREFAPGLAARPVPGFISWKFNASSSTTPPSPAAAVLPVGKFVFISSKPNPNLRINVETGLAASPRKDGDWSAQWIIKPVSGTNFFWIENRWKSGERLHLETSLLKSEKIKDDAWSAQWELIPAGDAYIIQNRWKKSHRLHLEKGQLECSVVPEDAKTALWKITLAGE